MSNNAIWYHYQIPIHLIQSPQSRVVQEVDISEEEGKPSKEYDRLGSPDSDLWTICEVGIPPLLRFLHCGFSFSPILRRPLWASSRSSSSNICIEKFLSLASFKEDPFHNLSCSFPYCSPHWLVTFAFDASKFSSPWAFRSVGWHCIQWNKEHSIQPQTSNAHFAF